MDIAISIILFRGVDVIQAPRQRTLAHAHVAGDQRQPAPARNDALRLPVHRQVFRSEVQIARVSRQFERIFFQTQPVEPYQAPIIIINQNHPWLCPPLHKLSHEIRRKSIELS